MIEEKKQQTEEIAEHLKQQFNISVYDAVPIDKGWLNVKWRMETERGPIFVKFYHPSRYKLHLRPERKAAIHRTLKLQHRLSLSGVKCPRVYHRHEQYLHETPDGLHYAVLDWVDGNPLAAGEANEEQMFDLGRQTGKMHRWLQSVKLLDEPDWKPDPAAYAKQWQVNWDKAKDEQDEIVMEWLLRSRQLVDGLDFRMFDSCDAGWLHWDLWVDNILVEERGVAGIVDFDRMSMAYPELDLARAALSGTLRDGQLNIDAIEAFMEGYREHVQMPKGCLPRALCMLYLMESTWWLRTEVRKESELRSLLQRFIEEMHWNEDHWEELPELLAHV